MYVFSRNLPSVLSALNELVNESKLNQGNLDLAGDPHTHRICMDEEEDGVKGKALSCTAEKEAENGIDNIIERYIAPLESLDKKLFKYRQLVEHVVDMDKLPDLVISPQHDEELSDLREQSVQLENEAKQIYQEAINTWASFDDVKLEQNNQHSFYLRTTKCDDERQLRQNNPRIQIIGLLKVCWRNDCIFRSYSFMIVKATYIILASVLLFLLLYLFQNGVHFTTPKLSAISDNYQSIENQYRKKQIILVKNAVTTALTYMPLFEAASKIISEIDVLCSFATVAALSPSEYVRPVVYAMNEEPRKIILKGARHPCVEVMDNVNFIANDYDMVDKISNFQIMTGPNMVRTVVLL